MTNCKHDVDEEIYYLPHLKQYYCKECECLFSKEKKEDLEIVYRCHPCKKEFDPNELPDMEEFDEEGNWEHLCPICKQPLKWGFKQ